MIVKVLSPCPLRPRRSLVTLPTRSSVGGQWSRRGTCDSSNCRRPAALPFFNRGSDDTLVYDGDALAFLVKAYGPQSLLIGTDYPFSVMEKDPIGALAAGVPPGAHFDAIATANACRFLALD
ncbi:hypothetical protein GCM10007242_21120 [Pigmentiphaga litoralis]|nr:hypothetical protein GCM10007242_21120 [Pigmentiphaga litoralis]